MANLTAAFMERSPVWITLHAVVFNDNRKSRPCWISNTFKVEVRQLSESISVTVGGQWGVVLPCSPITVVRLQRTRKIANQFESHAFCADGSRAVPILRSLVLVHALNFQVHLKLTSYCSFSARVSHASGVKTTHVDTKDIYLSRRMEYSRMVSSSLSSISRIPISTTIQRRLQATITLPPTPIFSKGISFLVILVLFCCTDVHRIFLAAQHLCCSFSSSPTVHPSPAFRSAQ
jgi:hypothetical protein